MTLLGRMEAVRAVELHPRDKAVLVWLAFHAGESWPRCWPTVETLAEDTGYSVRTVIHSTAALASRGLIDVRRRRSTSNVYTLKITAVDAPVSADAAPTVSARIALPEVRGLHPNLEVEPRTLNKRGLDHETVGHWLRSYAAAD